MKFHQHQKLKLFNFNFPSEVAVFDPLCTFLFQLGIVNLIRGLTGGQREGVEEEEREAAQTFHLIHQVWHFLGLLPQLVGNKKMFAVTVFRV